MIYGLKRPIQRGHLQSTPSVYLIRSIHTSHHKKNSINLSYYRTLI